MQVAETIAELRAHRSRLHGSLGLVPTMGSLHEGHLALVRRARAENDLVAVSIFANPIQFNSSDDFDRYPRDLERDLQLLAAEGVDLVLAPPVTEIYPPGFATYVDVGVVTEPLEGSARPGHFRGVATVVSKLFHIFQPDRAYFGQKDAQQVMVIKKMVTDLDFPLSIVVVPTVRDQDGLALSSRNARLTAGERDAASAIPDALRAAIRLYEEGERSAAVIRAAVLERLSHEPLLQPEYVSLADTQTLRELDVLDRPALLSLAVGVGQVRLIDNVMLGEPESYGSLVG